MTIRESVEQIEEDRKEREEGLLLLLLALSERARQNVNRALRVGTPWPDILHGVLLGDEALDQPGGLGFLSRGLADTYRAGYRRAGSLVGVEIEPEEDNDELALLLLFLARAQLTRIGVTLESEIAKSLRSVEPADRIIADVRAVGEAFRRAGFTPDSRHGAVVEATAAVTQAYAAGMADATKRPEVRAVLAGLRFINPLDARTTDICRKRAGVKLPLDHPWWFTNWPPLHMNCRSVVLPVTDRFEFREDPPVFPPPEPGWGQWGGLLSSRQYA